MGKVMWVPANDWEYSHQIWQFTTPKSLKMAIDIGLWDTYLVGGLVAIFYVPINIKGLCHHPNWRTHIFQRGGPTTNQLW